MFDKLWALNVLTSMTQHCVCESLTARVFSTFVLPSMTQHCVCEILTARVFSTFVFSTERSGTSPARVDCRLRSAEREVWFYHG